ncbi:hypothetical protein PS1_010220 [Malus domestica]
MQNLHHEINHRSTSDMSASVVHADVNALGNNLSFPLYTYPKTVRTASNSTSYSFASSFNSNRVAANDDPVSFTENMFLKNKFLAYKT